MIEFTDAMQQAGISPPVNILSDGILHRFHIEGDKPRSENGWFVLHDDPPAGAFGSWKDGSSETWSANTGRTLTSEEKARHRANLEASKAQKAKEQERIYAEARDRATEIYNKAKVAPADHPYLMAKGVKPHQLKESQGALVITLRDSDGTLHGLQFINDNGEKKFLTGTAKKGNYFAIGKPDNVLCLAEGFATAASIHESTGYAVAVAFDAGNMLHVAQALRSKFPELKIIICGDNDRSGTGQDAAKKAALAVGGFFALPPEQGQDFNDMHNRQGIDDVRLQIEKAILPLGPEGEDLTEGLSGGQSEAPMLFDSIETPEISAALLPAWLGDYAEAVARNTQTPPAMAVMLALSTVATCTAKRFEVAPHGEGYTEPLNIWTATALPPANRKTAVISAMTGPLVEWEEKESDRLAPEIKRVDIERGIIEKRIKNLEAAAAKEATTLERQLLASEIQTLMENMPEQIIDPRLWTGDTTPERLQSLLADHGERMAVLTDEGGIFEVMAGLYSDGRANLDIFLQSHAGRAVRVDRQSRTEQLNAPALSFGLAIQPAILADMGNGGKKHFRGNGTLARFLFVIPRSNIGKRDVRASYHIPETIAARYRAGIFGLLEITPQMIDGQEKPRRLTLTQEAIDSWQAFSQMIEERQGEGGDLETIQDWSGKLPGVALRIAGNFHLVEFGGNPPVQIEEATIEKALDLCTLLIDHAKSAFAMMEADTTTGDAKAVLKWINDKGLSRFKKSEIWPKFKSRFVNKPERLEKVLKELQTRHIVAKETKQTTGRPSTIFIVNPMIWGAL